MVWSCLINAAAVFVLVPKLCLLKSMGIFSCIYRQWIKPRFFTFAFTTCLIFSNTALCSLQLCVCVHKCAQTRSLLRCRCGIEFSAPTPTCLPGRGTVHLSPVRTHSLHYPSCINITAPILWVSKQTCASFKRVSSPGELMLLLMWLSMCLLAWFGARALRTLREGAAGRAHSPARAGTAQV